MMISNKKLRKLSNVEYREEYLKSTVTAWIVHQLRALRSQRGWTQSDLAKSAGDIPQSAVARYESEEYGNWSTNTLLKLAKAFDVALEIRFVSWPHFIRETEDTSVEAMQVSSFSSSSFLAITGAYQRFPSPPSEQQLAPPNISLRAIPYTQDYQVSHRNGLN